MIKVSILLTADTTADYLALERVFDFSLQLSQMELRLGIAPVRVEMPELLANRITQAIEEYIGKFWKLKFAHTANVTTPHLISVAIQIAKEEEES